MMISFGALACLVSGLENINKKESQTQTDKLN